MLNQELARSVRNAARDEARATHNGDVAIVTTRSQQGTVDSIVGIVIAESVKERLAMTTTSFAEAAHHPCSLWLAIEKRARVHALVEQSNTFSLAILHVKQRSLAQFCDTLSGRSDSELQQQGAAINVCTEGRLFLNGALASNACEVREAIDFEDRTLFIADIAACYVDSRRTHQRQLLWSELRPA